MLQLETRLEASVDAVARGFVELIVVVVVVTGVDDTVVFVLGEACW